MKSLVKDKIFIESILNILSCPVMEVWLAEALQSDTSIDLDDLTGDICCFIRDQKTDQWCNIVNGSEPPQVDAVSNIGQSIVIQHSHHVRMDISWRYGIDTHIMRSDFCG